MDLENFFRLHKGLDREGPGGDESLDWALALADVPGDGVICDAGCGPGADIPGLLRHVPLGRVEALDLHQGFVDEAQARLGEEPRALIRQGDMGELTGPYDLIWSAGALYFLGVEAGLRAWRDALAPGGAVAFSQACWFTDAPSDATRAYWAQEYPEMTDEAGVLQQVRAAGYDVLGSRRLSDAEWEAYFGSLERRIATLRPGADDALAAVLDQNAAEIAIWRGNRDQFGYLMVVGRPA